MAPYRGVRSKGNNTWGMEITLRGHKRWLGTWTTPELAAHTYENIALELFGRSEQIKFPEMTHVMKFLMPGIIWILTMAEMKEHLKAERHLFNPLVVALLQEDPSLLEEKHRAL